MRKPSRTLYACVRAVAGVVLRVWFRPRVSGAEHIPRAGAAIIVANHKSFLDAFFIGLAAPRPVRFMAKAEIFRGPLRPILLRLGAFPIRRGEADHAAFETCLELLRDGELVVVFPEGTRVDDADALARPHHGAARLALAGGVPIVPGAIAGTQRLWIGPIPKPRRVRLTFLPAVPPPRADGANATEALLDDAVWPEVLEEYGRLRATPGVVIGALATIGIGTGVVARRRARAQPRLIDKLGPRRVRRKGKLTLRRRRAPRSRRSRPWRGHPIPRP